MKHIALVLCVAVLCAVTSVFLVESIDRMSRARIPVTYPMPPPPPTMTVTLSMGEDLTETWTIVIPTKQMSSWKNFTIDPGALEVNEEGLVRCELFFSRD
jgi:hypothetical protein